MHCCCHIIHSVVSDSVTSWTVAHQAPLSMGFSRQEYWSGLPLLPPEYFPDPGTELRSPVLQANSLLFEPPGVPISSVQSLSRVRLFTTLLNHSTPGLPVHHKLPEFTQTHAHRVSDAI